MVAAIAITSVTSVVSAQGGQLQQYDCTIETEYGTVMKSYQTSGLRAQRTPTGFNLVERATGRIVDTFDCELVGYTCSFSVGANPVRPTTPRPTTAPTTPRPFPTSPSPSVGVVTTNSSTSPGGVATSSENVSSENGVNIATGTVTDSAGGN